MRSPWSDSRLRASPIPEIGARMFISRGTVKVDLSHIFAKLGVSTRAESLIGQIKEGAFV